MIKDLVVDRGAFDRIIQAGGYISAPTGTAPDAHATPVGKRDADRAFDAATCIGCGACVAACPNGSAMLFTAAKITHLGLLTQGQPERYSRVVGMVAQHDMEGFGGCTNIGECTAVCPKQIPLESIARLNRDLIKALSHGGSHWPKAAPRRDELEEEEPDRTRPLEHERRSAVRQSSRPPRRRSRAQRSEPPPLELQSVVQRVPEPVRPVEQHQHEQTQHDQPGEPDS